MRFIQLGAAIAVGGLGLGALRYSLRARPNGRDEASEADGGIVQWCAVGLEPIVGGGCLAMPRRSNAPLLLYLHGRYDASQPAEELERQQRVAKKATERGFAVLALRGELGACKRAEFTNWYCWPSNERTAEAGPTFVGRWSTALEEATRRGATGDRFVLGFSNGAYFSGLIATRSLFDAGAFIVAAGGPVDPIVRANRMPPILLLTGDDDISADDTVRFGRLLTRAGWPNDIYAREGGHQLTNGDVDAVLTFLDRSRREPVPLVPPIATMHRPLPPRDASVAADRDGAPPEQTPSADAAPVSAEADADAEP
jgi:predicted esterase